MASKKSFDLFVARIPWTLSAKELLEYFEQFGHVRKCILPFNRNTGFHKGICWVRFSTEQGMCTALERDPHVVEGSTLKIPMMKKAFGEPPSSRDAEDD